MKKHLSILLLMPFILLFLCSFTTFRQETGQGHANVTSASTPTVNGGETLWSRALSPSGDSHSYNSDPVIKGTAIYIANGDTLYELDKTEGSIRRTLTLSSHTNSVCHMLLEGNNLYIPLSGGLIECVDIQNMISLWQSHSFGGQSLSTLFYHDGALYGGTVNMISGTDSTGVFYCIDAASGDTVWTYEDTENPGGYYWSGAILCQGVLYFIGDNGILVAHDPVSEEVFDMIPLTDTAKIRAGLTYDPDTGSLFTASTDGRIYRIPVSEDGSIHRDSIRSGSAVPSASALNCTSTPTIYRGRLYVGCIADGYGYLSVLDAGNLSLIYAVQGERSAEIKSSPLISTGYATEENNHSVYVYVSANQPPGGIYYLLDNSACTTGVLWPLYTPVTGKQFCMSSITCDENGVLYYSNDSNTLFAVIELNEPTCIGMPLPPLRNEPIVLDPGIPDSVRIKKKKKKIILTWEKTIKNSQTLIYTKYGKGKWKKKIIRSGTKYSIMRKKKTLRIRLRSRIRRNSQWVYSKYSKTYKIKRR